MKTFLEERGCSLLLFIWDVTIKGTTQYVCSVVFIETFVTKYFTLLTVSWNIINLPNVFHQISGCRFQVLDKRRSQWVNVPLKQCVFGRVAVNERYILFNRERTNWKMPEQINSVVYLYVILFKTPQKDTAIEDERFKRSTKWISKLVSAK